MLLPRTFHITCRGAGTGFHGGAAVAFRKSITVAYSDGNIFIKALEHAVKIGVRLMLGDTGVLESGVR